ncbi:BppU family phage baseplate upper protein [Enterococcus faecalis]|uniref:BppU family phage baseplate upper protein n=1 Tax=Enterococcus faecalis TaxID=1351 RepID=UPI00325B65D8
MANKILNLDFSKDPIMPPIIYGRVGDEKMQTITVKISRRDEIPDLSGGVITFEGEPAGGKVKVFDSENVSSNSAGLQKGTFEYTFPSAAFSVEGTYKRAYFSFQKDGKRDTTGDFKIIVKGNADIDSEEAETIITEYNKLVTALNEAYQAALKKIDADYDAVVARIESIKKEMNALQAKIDKTVSDAEGRISKVATDSETKITTIGKTVTDAMNAALEELRAADFYTRTESDSRYVSKVEMENGPLISKKEVINTQDWNKILNKGIYTVFGASGENRPYSGAVYGALVVYADNTFISQSYTYKGETYTRSRQGSPATWTDWTKVASTEYILAENKVYRYLRTSLDLSGKVQAAKDAINATESKIDIFRIGNMVFFNMRINVTDYTKFGNDMPVIYDLPIGFRTLGDLIANTYFNNSLSVSQWAFSQAAAKNYMAIVEGAPQDIRFGSAHNGNTYVQGFWLTKDPFPKEGSLNGGTVSILNRLPDGSLA